MINTCTLSGRIATDPEMRYTTTGKAVVNFRLAVDRGRKGQDGQEQADFLDIVTFEKTAEFVAQWLDKGALVGVEGRIQARDWQTSDGQARRTIEIVASRVHFLESKFEAERRRAAKGVSGPRPAAPAGAPAVAPPPDAEYGAVRDDEDPFGDQ